MKPYACHRSIFCYLHPCFNLFFLFCFSIYHWSVLDIVSALTPPSFIDSPPSLKSKFSLAQRFRVQRKTDPFFDVKERDNTSNIDFPHTHRKEIPYMSHTLLPFTYSPSEYTNKCHLFWFSLYTCSFTSSSPISSHCSSFQALPHDSRIGGIDASRLHSLNSFVSSFSFRKKFWFCWTLCLCSPMMQVFFILLCTEASGDRDTRPDGL